MNPALIEFGVGLIQQLITHHTTQADQLQAQAADHQMQAAQHQQLLTDVQGLAAPPPADVAGLQARLATYERLFELVQEARAMFPAAAAAQPPVTPPNPLG